VAEPRGDAPAAAKIAIGALLALFAVQAILAATRDSVTIDEFVGLPVGLHALQSVDFRTHSMNPPFFRSFAALPLLARESSEVQMPVMVEVNDWAMGYQFMKDNAGEYQELFFLPRCMVIFTALLLGMLAVQWATELYGLPSGLIVALLFCFSPTILAYAHLLTLDISGAIGWTAVAYLTWRLLDSPTPSRAAALGLMLGLAPVLKLSGVMLPFVSASLVLVRMLREPGISWLRWSGLLAFAYAVALGVLNGLYRFEGFGTPLAHLGFVSHKMQAIARLAPWLRLPLPAPFLASVDTLFAGDQPSEPAYFLAGSWSLEGWWYYHLVAFSLKTPLPELAAGLFAVAAWILGKSRGKRDYCVVLPLLFVFVANSLLNPLNIGVRHALPAYPLLAIAASPWLAAPLARLAGGSRALRDLAGATLSTALLAWFIYGSVRIAPRYLQYFNEVAGGPANGHQWLIDSNLDWGQDLIRLSEYMRRRGLESVHLGYFGRVDPRVYGIGFTPLVEGESHGTAVVSASFLMGRPYSIWRSPGQLDWSKNGAFRWLQGMHPIDRVGSLFVFELP
jgi:hypothetical protein